MRFLPVLILVLSAPAAGAQTKEAFVEGLIAFVAAADGGTGTAGPALVQAVEAMEAGLAQWDQAVARAEAGMAAQIGAAPPAEAVKMRTALGLLYLERGRFTDALLQFDRAAASPAASPDIHTFRGWALRAAGRPVEAAAAFRRAFDLDPSNPLRAYLALHQARVAGAAVPPRARTALVAAEASLGMRAPVRVLAPALLDDAGASEPILPWPADAEAFPLLAQGRYREAAALLRAAAKMPRPTVDAAPESAPARWRLAQQLLSRDRAGEALPHLEAVARARPLAGAGALHRLIGQLKENHFDSDGAIASFVRAVDLNPNDVSSHRELAEALQGVDRLEDARAEFVFTLLLDPADAVAWAGLGQIHAAGARLKDAVAALRRAVALDGRRPEARYALARALIGLGLAEEGRKELAIFEELQREAMNEQRRRFEDSVNR